MVQIRAMRSAGVIVRIHVSMLPLLSSLAGDAWAAESAKIGQFRFLEGRP